jgi:hypothetical protein
MRPPRFAACGRALAERGRGASSVADSDLAAAHRERCRVGRRPDHRWPPEIGSLAGQANLIEVTRSAVAMFRLT